MRRVYRKTFMMTALLLVGCVCPDSFREVPEPRVRQVADVAEVSDCQMQHYGATLLARAESAALVEALVQAGADVHGNIIVNGHEYQGNPLVQAQKTEVLQALLRSGAAVNARCGDTGATPLCDALRKGQRAKVGVLLAAGANPGLADAKGESPLYIAAMRADVDMCRQLLGAGAAVDAGKSTDGTTPLMAVLRAAHEGKVPQSGADNVAQLLMDAGAQLASADSVGNTLLHYASPAVVHRLLAAGLPPDVTNHLGRTPLFCCKERAVVDALLGAGANVQARDADGASAFDVVPSPQIKSYLLFRGCRSGQAL